MAGQAAAIGAALRDTLARVGQELILEIDRELRIATPVDTGHARANWVPSVGSPHEGEVQGEGERSAGVAEVLRFTLEDGMLFLANAAPYIRRLNYGHSKQAPALFIESCVDRALTTVQARYAGKVDISGIAGRVRADMAGGL